MAVRAETIDTVEELSRITGFEFTIYNVGPWQNDKTGRLSNVKQVPHKRGIYAHGFLINDHIVLYYGGLTAAKAPNGLRTRIQHEYNKKCASLSKSGPYETCLFLEHYSLGGLPIVILFHDMSDKTDDEIAQAEQDLLKALDFCANIKDNGRRRLDDLVSKVKELLANTKPFMNIVEEAEEVEEPGEAEEQEQTSDEYNRAFFMESSEFLSDRVLKEIHAEAMRVLHQFKADKVKEYLSEKVLAQCGVRAKI